MRRKQVLGIGALVLVVGALIGIGIGSAGARVDVQHGLSFTKGCVSPTTITAAYTCTYSIRNIVDEAQDTMTISGFSDTVHASGGNVTTAPTAFSALKFEIGPFLAGFSTPPTCTGPGISGNGSAATPWVNATLCTIPYGARLNVQPFSFYTVLPADYGLPGHVLLDDAVWNWNDLCNDPIHTGNTNCNPNPPPNGAGSSTVITQIPSTTLTDIHNAGHAVVTSVPVGSTVHDLVRVNGVAGNPPPTGQVSVDWFLNGDCSGAPALNSGPLGPLAPSGGSNASFDATAFAFTVNTAGMRAFRGHYLGDPGNPTYSPSDGACEPLAVVDANIQITPNGTNQVNHTHSFTGHAFVSTGIGGFVNAPDGTAITFSIASGPGSFTTTNPCTTTGGTGSCTITLTSPTTGVTTVNASTTVSVLGNTLTRTTNGTGGNSGPAVKTWVDARIAIAPNATNAVGAPHTFTVTLQKDPGTGVFVAAAGEHVDFTLTNSNGAGFVLDAAASTCDDAGANTNAAGQCTIVFTSPTPGKVTGHASSTLLVGPAPPASITVQTSGTAGNSPDAVKTFVDANIQVTPNGTNWIGVSHTFTAHVNINDGSGAGYVNAPAGTFVTFTIDSGPGQPNPPSSCVTGANGSCDTVQSSPVPGVTVFSAHTTLSVGGVTLTRHTNGTAGNSGPATKRWVNARISIAPNATNAVGQPHTFAVTLQQDTGNGAGFVAFPGQHVNVTLTPGGGATPVVDTAASTCDDAGPNTNASGECTIVFTSNTTGTVTGTASATVSVMGSASFGVSTNGVGGNSGPAVKTFVNANIQITPATATNPVGTNHVLTITVNAIGGTIDAGPHTATASIVSGPGSFVGSPSCTYTGGAATATCTVTITSAVSGTTVVSATSNIPVAGLTISRTTNTAVNTAAGGSGNANKAWAAARITISPNAVNEVGQSHTFVVAVELDSGAGFVGIANQHVDVTLTPTFGVLPIVNTAASTCDNAGPNTDANGRCTIVFASATPGVVTGNATVTITLAGGSVTLTTNGVAPNSGPAVKTFVDANIQITPATDTNPVGSPHVLTVHVNVNPGTGFVNAPAGTPVTVTVTSGPGAITGSPCLTVGATGSCTVTLNSATPGTSVISASVTTVVNTLTLTRTTNGTGANSAPAQKLWADSTVRTDIHNASHVVVTAGTAGDVVHDKVFVTKAAGTPAAIPAPTGSVTFHRYATLNCSGAAVDQTVALAADGTAESATFTVVSDMSYRADYAGDANYPARAGACEPLTVQTSGCPLCPPPPCPAFPVFPGQGGGGGACSLNVLSVSMKGTLLEITIQNTGSADAVLNGLGLTFPTSNGGLKSAVLDGQLYTGPVVTGGSFTLTAAQLAGVNPVLRTIKVGQSEKLRFVFEKPASTNKAAYTSVVEFNTGCIINLFP